MWISELIPVTSGTTFIRKPENPLLIYYCHSHKELLNKWKSHPENQSSLLVLSWKPWILWVFERTGITGGVHLFWFIIKNQIPVTALANTTQRECRISIRHLNVHNLWKGDKHNRLNTPGQDYQLLGIHYTPVLLNCPFG